MDPVTGGARVDDRCMTGVAGIFACGNVLQVHDLVDYVSDEAERAGIGAAEFVKNGLSDGETLATQAGNGVRYVIPQTVRKNSREVSLFLRVTQPFGRVKFTVTAGDTVLTEVKRLKAAPGEMERITLKPEQLALARNTITVALEEL